MCSRHFHHHCLHVCIVARVLGRQFAKDLRTSYDRVWNGDPHSLVLKHHCWDGNDCKCISKEDTVVKMARTATRTIFLRRPKRPEVKEWTAVGATILFKRFVGFLFLPLALTVVGCSFLCSFLIFKQCVLPGQCLQWNGFGCLYGVLPGLTDSAWGATVHADSGHRTTA